MGDVEGQCPACGQSTSFGVRHMIDRLTEGTIRDLTATVDKLGAQEKLLKERIALLESQHRMAREVMQIEAGTAAKEIAELQKQVAHWKANHDNQVAIKRALCVRADLPAHDEIRQLLAKTALELDESKDQLAGIEAQWHDARNKIHQAKDDIDECIKRNLHYRKHEENAILRANKLEEERDLWKKRCDEGWRHPEEVITETNRLREKIAEMDAERERYIQLEVEKHIVMEKARADSAALQMHAATKAQLQAEELVKEARDALESMCEQYLPVRKGKLQHDYMSAGERAFAVLGWDMKGHPVPERMCDEPGCEEEASCGYPTATGYRRTCFTHYSPEESP